MIYSPNNKYINLINGWIDNARDVAAIKIGVFRILGNTITPISNGQILQAEFKNNGEFGRHSMFRIYSVLGWK